MIYACPKFLMIIDDYMSFFFAFFIHGVCRPVCVCVSCKHKMVKKLPWPENDKIVLISAKS